MTTQLGTCKDCEAAAKIWARLQLCDHGHCIQCVCEECAKDEVPVCGKCGKPSPSGLLCETCYTSPGTLGLDSSEAGRAESAPDGFAYRYPGGIRFGTNGREINGSGPIEAIPFYYEKTVQAAHAAGYKAGQEKCNCSDCPVHRTPREYVSPSGDTGR